MKIAKFFILLTSMFTGFFTTHSLISSLNSLATSFHEQPFPEAVSDAPVIVRGKIGSSYANWVEDESFGRRIYTFYEIKVEEAFKGSMRSGRTLMMRELGGIKEGIGMEVPGAAHFSKDEDVVVFLGEANSDSSHDVYGLMMGKFNIEKDQESNEYLIGPGVNSAKKPKRWSLSELRSLIQSQETSSTSSKEETIQSQGSPSAQSKGELKNSQAKDSSKMNTQSRVLSNPVNFNRAWYVLPFWIYLILGAGAILILLWFFIKK